VRETFQFAAVVQLRVRVDAQQILGPDHALEGRQFAFLDFVLECSARHAHEACGTGQGQQLRAVACLV
jgi:uncharacterized protein (DUF1778 family)